MKMAACTSTMTKNRIKILSRKNKSTYFRFGFLITGSTKPYK